MTDHVRGLWISRWVETASADDVTLQYMAPEQLQGQPAILKTLDGK